jgi:cold shock CspA family protein
MPVRIYDISKKLGLENKQILEKAKSMGIAAAKIPSSSLDRISAEWLEEELIKTYPEAAAKLAPVEVKPQITITAIGAELYHLVERVVNGDIQLRLNVSESEAGEPLHISLVRDTSEKTGEAKLKFDLLTRVEIDESTKKLLRVAYLEAARHSTEDWINLAEYGNVLKKLEPTFQPQKFGERSLGSLLRRVPDFELRNDETNPIVYYLRMNEEKRRPLFTIPPQVSPAVVPPIAKLARGKIHNLRLGFGFIMPDDGSENAFFHATDVEGCTIFDLKPGDAVEYEPGTNERGPCARKIHRIG